MQLSLFDTAGWQLRSHRKAFWVTKIALFCHEDRINCRALSVCTIASARLQQGFHSIFILMIKRLDHDTQESNNHEEKKNTPFVVQYTMNDSRKDWFGLPSYQCSQFSRLISPHRNPEKKFFGKFPEHQPAYFAFIRHPDLCNRAKPWVRYCVLATLTG